MARMREGIESSNSVRAGGIQAADQGLAIERMFTREGVHPFDQLDWETRDAVIGDPAKPAFEQRDVEFPKSWSQNATNIVAQKYFRGQLGTEKRECSVKQMVGRVAGTIAAWGREGGYFASAGDADAFEAELTHILVNQLAAFNSPVWFNVGFEESPQASACFILSVDDTIESILDWNTKEGMIFRGGSGSGINLSKIRGSKEQLSKGGLASGPVSFMRGADAWAGTIKSGGKTRRAAKMVVLDVDHPDIRDFIWCKAREEEKAEALRQAGFDMSIDGEGFRSIQYQNANNSVRVTQEFLDAVERGEEWRTIARVSGEPMDTFDARELMKEIAEAAWRCADPGVQYDTTINDWHTCPNTGRINASNPCCFVGDTPVETSEGAVRFDALWERCSAGESLPEVHAYDTESGSHLLTAISQVWIAGMASSLVEVQTELGQRLRCTPEHRFLTNDGQYVEARSLAVGTPLRTGVRERVPAGAVQDAAEEVVDRVLAVRPVALGEPVPVYDMEVAGPNNFAIGGEGGHPVVVHNSEYMHVDNSACNLASINLLKFLREDSSFDTPAFEHTVDVMFLAQEILVGFSSYPTEEITKNAKAMRQLGLGYANLGALLMARGLPYDSDEGRSVAAAITALMTGRAYRTSGEIAAAVGPYDEFAKNREPHLRVMRKHRDAAYEIDEGVESELVAAAQRSWNEAVELGEKYGHRNAQASVLAPTGTISFLMDCDTTGVEPDFSLVKIKELVGGGNMTIVNRTVPRALRRLGYSDAEIEQIEAYVNEHRTIVGAPGLKDEHLPVFDVAVGERAISHMGHIKMMAAAQPFISGAISKTVNMPADSTVEDIEDAYLEAGRLGIKALAIYRDGSKTAQALRTDAKKEKDAEADSAGPAPQRHRLPRERESLTHKFSIAGHEGYITAGKYEDGSLGEIFLTDIGKDGSTLRGMMNAFATAISIGLQYGVPLETFVRKFSYMRFDPEGMTTNPEIPFAKSLPDYIMRWLASRFLESEVHEELGIMSEAVRAKKMAEEAAVPGNGGNGEGAHPNGGNGHTGSDPTEGEATVPTAALTDTPPVVPAKIQGLDLGPACSQCGGMMQRTGSCYTCSSCGNNTGCG
jgi:ribonucleotide reductase alpha subunit